MKHGRSGYNQGCRCEVCKQDNSEYKRQRRQAKAAKVAKQPVRHLKAVQKVHIGGGTPTAPTPECGPTEAAVREQLAALSTVPLRRGEAEIAYKLARVLDTPSAVAHWPAAAHRLGELIDKLRKGSDKKTGKLAAVRQMTRPAADRRAE